MFVEFKLLERERVKGKRNLYIFESVVRRRYVDFLRALPGFLFDGYFFYEAEFFEIQLKNVKRYVCIYILKRELNYERLTEGIRLIKRSERKVI